MGNGIDHPEVVDLVAEGADGSYRLIVVETGRWDGSAEQLLKFQSKLNHYLTYVFDGQMHREHPESEGRPVVLELDYFEPLDAVTEEFIRKARDIMSGKAVAFEVKRLPRDEP